MAYYIDKEIKNNNVYPFGSFLSNSLQDFQCVDNSPTRV